MTPPQRWPSRGDGEDAWRQLGDQFERWQRQSPRAPMLVGGVLLLGLVLLRMHLAYLSDFHHLLVAHTHKNRVRIQFAIM